MKYQFEPHVPGEFGEYSIIDHRFEPFRVYHLHMVFDFTPDDFCQSFPVYFISEKLLNALIDQNVTGFSNPRLISHEQNEQSSVKLNNNKFFMIDVGSDLSTDLYIVDSKLVLVEKVRKMLMDFIIRFGTFEARDSQI